MKIRNFLSLLIVSVGFILASSSCSNELTAAVEESLTLTATDEAQASTLSNTVLTEADVYVNSVAASNFTSPMAVKGTVEITGPTVTIDKKDSVTFPKVITIDYGSTGITGKNGNIIKGKIIITISDKLWKTGSTKTIKLVDFYVNSNNIKGIKTITNNGLNAAKNPSMTVVVSDTIVRVDKSTIIRNSNRTREKINDGGTPKDFSDDMFSITGGSTGINAKGIAYTVVITKRLIEYNNYKHFVKGTITTTTEKRTIILDYGDGTKDDKATITINGKTKEITLKN